MDREEYNKTQNKINDNIEERFNALFAKSSSIRTLCEEYAAWTLPYLFPPTGLSQGAELQIAKDSIGARAVNHLSNKLVSTLFPGQRMFFRLHVDAKTRKRIITALSSEMSSPGSNAQEEVELALNNIETQLADAEQEAQEYMNMVVYRPEAVTSAKLLIITGNSLMYHPEGSNVQVYTLKNYVVVRDLSGNWVEIVTKDEKAFETFKPDVQDKLRMNKDKKYTGEFNVCVYTRIILEDDGKYHAYQQADHVSLETNGASWPKDKCPWIPLTWNLIRGEDYGRGLVGDYAGAFHGVNVLTGSLLNIAAIMGDIKFFVNPQSGVDIPALNAAPSGSYHPGKEGDITTAKVDRIAEAQFIATMVDRYEKQIAASFLLNSELTRQAERVTAEEIRRDAEELELSNGGIYSALAAKWQVPTAYIVLDQIGFDGVGQGIQPQIITGMDSLSRAGELDNIRMFIMDMQALQTVPEDVRMRIDLSTFMGIVAVNRNVTNTSFIKSEATVQAEIAKQQEVVAQQEAQKQQAGMMNAAGTEAMKQGGP